MKLTFQRSKKILIVDDEEELLALLSLKLTNSGFEVILAATGEEAKSLLSEHQFSAVLCDLNLPNSPRGRELYEHCSQIDHPTLFIVMTGFTQDSPEVRAARGAGLTHVFSKPLRLKSIIQLIADST